MSNLIRGRYSEEEKLLIIELSEEGFLLKEIAERINRPLKNVAAYRRKHWKGIRRNVNWSTKDLELILAYIILDHRNQVVNKSEIAALFEVSEQTISRKLIELKKRKIIANSGSTKKM